MNGTNNFAGKHSANTRADGTIGPKNLTLTSRFTEPALIFNKLFSTLGFIAGSALLALCLASCQKPADQSVEDSDKPHTVVASNALTTASAQCGKDTDCKGDRICQQGVCTAPGKTDLSADVGLATADQSLQAQNLSHAAQAGSAAQSGKPLQSEEDIAGVISQLQGHELSINSPAMQILLSRLFPNQALNTGSSTKECAQRDSEPCQWYAANHDDDPQSWPNVLLWFKKDQLISVTLAGSNILQQSAAWSCNSVKGAEDMVDCFHGDIPEAVQKQQGKLHSQFLSAAG